MELLLAIVLLALVASFVSRPLLRPRGDGGADPAEAERAELEARKQAKYRQIRDAEAERAMGKLSEDDFGRLNRELRAEAVEILKLIDRLGRR